MLYAHKLTTRGALEKTSCSQGLDLEQEAASHPPFHTSSFSSLAKETHGSSGQCVSFLSIDVASGFTAYVDFSFFLFHMPQTSLARKLEILPTNHLGLALESMGGCML